MLTNDVITAIADELADGRPHARAVPRITARYPDATVEDSYAVQRTWRDRGIAAGRRLVGRKIGLTSKAMQAATGITEPDYGVMFADTVLENGSTIPFDRLLQRADRGGARVRAEGRRSRARPSRCSTCCAPPTT